MTEVHAGVVDRDALKRYVERTLNLRAERKEKSEALAGVMAEAKSAGFVPEMIRSIVRELEMDAEARGTFYVTQAAYRLALGLGQLAGTPLGEAAVERDRPKAFAQQPVHRGRGRPRKPANGGDPLEVALAAPAGTA